MAKEDSAQFEQRIKELEAENQYWKGEAKSIWAELRKRQKSNLEIAQRIVRVDRKAIANIILNMQFGKTPVDGCDFCEIFDLRGKGRCGKWGLCTDCIDNFLREHYTGGEKWFMKLCRRAADGALCAVRLVVNRRKDR